MLRKIIIALSAIITICPFILLPIFYDNIPQQVAIFFNMKGIPTLTMSKSILTVLRLPLMGVMIQIICFTMYSVNCEYEREKNQTLWLSVSFLAALKMSLTSVEVIIYNNTEVLSFLRTIVLIVITIAVCIIIFNGYLIYNKYKKQFGKYFLKVTTLQKMLVLFSCIGYLSLVLFPLIS